MKPAKIVQSDYKGQIVIPKGIRQELEIEEGSAFWIYTSNNNIILEKVEKPKSKTRK